jgi:hypothetical protein
VSAPEPPPEESGDWVDRYFLPFVREPTLWPVLIVVIGHAAAFITPVILIGVRDRGVFALAALLAVAGLSLSVVRFELRERGGIGGLTAVLAAVWITSAALAWVADATGIF